MGAQIVGDGFLNNKLKQAAFCYFVLVMRPVARVLLRCGVSWKELVELIKLVYVDVAAQDYGKRGRPANASRVAILTGLSRRDVKRAKDMLEKGDEFATFTVKRIDHATRVLSGWHQDADFSDGAGKARLLPMHGERSFEALLKRYAADIPVTAMLKELEHVGALRVTPGGKLRATATYFMPAHMEVDSIVRGGSVLHDLATTLTHNQLGDEKSKRFEGRATNARVKRTARRAFKQYVEKRGMLFLEDVDSWLSAHEADEGDDKTQRLGIGVYLITDD